MKWHFFFISTFLITTFVHSSDDIELIISLVFIFEWVFIEKMWVRWGKRRELRTVNVIPNEAGSQVFVIEFPINPKKDKWLLWNPGDCIGVVCELVNQEEHIFTIASSPYAGKLRLCIQITHAEPERDVNPLISRTVKQWTTKLGKQIRKARDKSGLFIPFLLSPPLPTQSGMYSSYENIIFITSGTGITPGLAVFEHWVHIHAKQLDKKKRMFELVRMYRTHKSMEFSDKIFLSWEPITGAKWNKGTLAYKNLTAFSVSLISGENTPPPPQYKETALRINMSGARDEKRKLTNQKKVAVLFMLIKEFKKKQPTDGKWQIFFCGAEVVAKLVIKAAWLNKKSVIAEMF